MGNQRARGSAGDSGLEDHRLGNAEGSVPGFLLAWRIVSFSLSKHGEFQIGNSGTHLV